LSDQPARFAAYCNEESRCSVHAVPDAESFVDAAVLFAERWAGDGEVSITVMDRETGERRCFHIDLTAAEVGSC